MDMTALLRILERNKRYKSLFLLLLRSSQFINSEKLAFELKVTSRTIKQDIHYLRDEFAELAIKILAKPAYGYRLFIEQNEFETALKAHFQISQPMTINNKFETRVHYILRRLLISEQAIKIEVLQQELFLSLNSSLSKELTQVRKILANYQLKLISKPYYGLSIQGATYRKVMLTIRMYKYFNRKTKSNFYICNYNKLFSYEKKQELTQLFNQTIQHSSITFSDIYAERFIIYLIYFYNVSLQGKLNLQLPILPFDYKKTEEYHFVKQLINYLDFHLTTFKFDSEILRFLTYIAIMSNDLYRFADCSEKNYNNLLKQTNEIRQFIYSSLKKLLQADLSQDQTGFKDLFKVLIPITMKVQLGVSDDIDLGFYNLNTIHSNPLLLHTIEIINHDFKQKYLYQFSMRETYFIFDIISGIFNRIELDKKKLRLAIIAINGRLSTQQLKFNIRHYFSDYIDKIETRMLYELDLMDKPNYDYYLCNDYGRNMDIRYQPIYYSNDYMSENEYVKSLQDIFYHSYQYDRVLPEIKCTEIEEKYKLNIFPVEEKLLPSKQYKQFNIPSGKQKISVFYNLSSIIENVQIYFFRDSKDFTLHSEIAFMVFNLNIDNNTKKLKMFSNVIKQIVTYPDRLHQLCLNTEKNYKFFFIQHKE